MADQYRKGTMKVELRHDNGMTLTKEHGFTIEEEPGKVLSFDLIAHPEYGYILLFANAVGLVTHWSTGQLEEARNIVNKAVDLELARRKDYGVVTTISE